VDLMEAEPSELGHRNAFNSTAFSAAPEAFAASIQEFIPECELSYDVDPNRQAIAESWRNQIDPTVAAYEWGFKTTYDVDEMTKDMLEKVKDKELERKTLKSWYKVVMLLCISFF